MIAPPIPPVAPGRTSGALRLASGWTAVTNYSANTAIHCLDRSLDGVRRLALPTRSAAGTFPHRPVLGIILP